ncbi:hypothetical protein EGI26_15455 [Lacihabitans sp. CCS-44]|uniref:M56 family metallopeptidase n=1 Tax=Lacihabitans sp. CCS-44 TaxID=2487331 RepID=UPI0020CBE1F5|nr:M56 family metallopeptidase [Lacihabitans sp. CCS-44]MCP9756560.1 hypothetical protein [Lacihabitans sp. CCS-44]
MEFLLKSSVCMTVFYGLYYFIFSKFTFHTINRLYLLISLALSIAIPILTFEKEIIKYYEPQSAPANQQTIETFEVTTPQKPFTEGAKIEDTSVSSAQILLILYTIGVFVFAFIFLKNILKIGSIISKMSFEKDGNLKIFDATDQFTNASFFNNIFIDATNLNPLEKTLVIKHEELHFKKHHSIDLLITALYKVFFWFNPVAYFIQNSLKEIHEFEVDEAIAKTHDSKEYANLLLKLCVSNKFEFVHQIGKLPLSERINFLFTKPTVKMKKSLYSICVPVLALAIMAFAKQKTVTVFKDKTDTAIVNKVDVKTYPLTLKADKNYTTWGFGKSLRMSPSNITLNHLTTVNYNGFHYEVNPNSLTTNTIKEVNKEFKKRNLELIITEEETDSDGNLTKLGLVIKHLKTKEMTQSEVFDMKNYRKMGENGAFFNIEAYDRNFKKSQISVIFGSKDLLVNKSNLPKSKHNTFSINSESSIISHSSDVINFTVYPDKLTLKAAEEAKAYFSENGFEFELKALETDLKGNLTKAKVLFGNQSQTFALEEMRHWIKLKSETNSKPHRMDESLVFEGILKTKETKISLNNSWFKAMEKSGKYEILGSKIVEKVTTLNQKKEIRTVYETNFLGENPLVIINGKEYPAEILTRINPKVCLMPKILRPENETALKKYGEKASDGYFELLTMQDFVLTSEKEILIEKEVIVKHLNLPKKRIQRIEFEDLNGNTLNRVVVHRENMESVFFEFDFKKSSKILFMLDGKPISEKELANSTISILEGKASPKITREDSKLYGEILNNYDGFVSLKTYNTFD